MTYKHIKVQLPAVPMGQGEELFPQSPETMKEYWQAMAAPDLLAALEKLARLGNGDHYGNSEGNMIARAAIAKARGAT